MQHSKCCVVSQPPWVQIPALPPLPPGPIGAGRFCYARMGVSACECCLLLLVAPRVFRAPEAPAAVCAGGRRPARESSAPRASLGASSRSPAVPSGPSGALHTSGAGALTCACTSSRSQARPRHRPPAPQPGPPIPAAPSTPAAPTLLRCGLVRRLEARPGLASRSTLYPQFRMQFPNACSLQLCEKPGISTITFQSMKYARGNCMRNLSGADLAAAFGCWGRTLRPFRCSSSQRRWGFCSIRSWLSACRRRVAPLMTPFPPFGGSVSVAGGGVAPKVQTASAKNAHNGRLWMRWSAFWAQQCLAGGACSQVKPLFRA